MDSIQITETPALSTKCWRQNLIRFLVYGLYKSQGIPLSYDYTMFIVSRSLTLTTDPISLVYRVFAHRCDVPTCLRNAARRDLYSTVAVYDYSTRRILTEETSAKLSEEKEAFYELSAQVVKHYIKMRPACLLNYKIA
ncbi:hypothetical protein T12_13775 [Trichinella patagoniensis]|uniref:Uncharacterized protein n=1 Tax=Trichinella patagoniensis TaxID=990121 RepID=A0A0V0ZWB8_9BILA|nr:hypothetical protein T12_13353 [Trichinella patagoniensis]KRY16783.1 hypothetical protein T12_13775 [Trichinella patagoniensis]